MNAPLNKFALQDRSRWALKKSCVEQRVPTAPGDRVSRWVTRSCVLVLLLIFAGSGLVMAQGITEVTTTEYQVYNAALGLMQFPKQDAEIVVADTTLNYRCGAGSGNPVLINNCGIWVPPSSAEEIFKLLHDSWPEMGKPTWDNLVSKSSRSARLQDRLKAPWPHKLVDVVHGVKEEGWKAPDGTIFFSRVGLRADNTEAVVYILFFSYMASLPTSGNFFLFRRDPAKPWAPAGRVTYMQTQ